MKRKQNRAQAYLEYAVLIALVALALIAIRKYFLQSVQERYRQSADVFGEGAQYAEGITRVEETSSSTDVTEPPDERNLCEAVVNQVIALENEINGYDKEVEGVNKHFKGLLERAAEFEANAVKIRAQAQVLADAGAGDPSSLIKQAELFEEQARGFRAEAAEKQEQINSLKTDYEDCF
ncbi:MAG: hypothetical protein WC321_06275 [Candidatus Omnitrophota bacterium]|jgi:Flp pilus assembly pilin Flp/DNA-binding FrmR family transcriptional regulator